MATTNTSQGRLLIVDQVGGEIPLGWAVDSAGRPTTSAAAGLNGALLPVGGPKGFGLAFAVDALVALAGARVSTEVSALGGDPATPQNLGHLLIAIRADAAQSLDEYRAKIAGLVDAIHASSDGLNVPPAIAPGEPELQRERAADGAITISDHVLAELSELAEATGIGLPASMAARAVEATSPSTLTHGPEGGTT